METNSYKKQLDQNIEEKSLKGTMVSVGVVAAVIVLVWVAVFWIYMDRI